MNLTDAYAIRKNSASRKENDYYPTPPIATLSLVFEYKDYIPNSLWEPAAGRGWISKTLEKEGYEVYSSDLFSYENNLSNIETGVDYFATKVPDGIQGIITNPPYKNGLAQAFVEKSIQEVSFSAFFLRLTFMESIKRYSFFKDNPPNILVFSRRVNCMENLFDTVKGQCGGMTAYAWYIWSKDLEGGRISWVDPLKIIENQKTLEDFF